MKEIKKTKKEKTRRRMKAKTVQEEKMKKEK
jgi:hypothetical protein